MKSLSVFMYFGLVVSLVKSESDPCYIILKKSDRDGQIKKPDNRTPTTPFMSDDTEFRLCNKTLKNVASLEELDAAFEVPSEFRGRNCLKNVTKCMQADDTYELTMTRLTKHLFTSTPPLDMTQVREVSEQCKKSSQKYLQGLRQYKLWALQMYDSSAKVSSGLLSGNVNQFGDFDLCLSTNSEDDQLKGQYCLASFQIEIPQSPYLAGIHSLMQSHYPFKSNLTDSGHRVPRFSSINWAFCIPSDCSSSDLETYLKSALNDVLFTTEIEYSLKIHDGMCQKAEDNKIPQSTIIVGIFFLSMLAIVFLSTMYDFFALEKKSDLFVAFSLKTNMTSMFSLSRSSSDLEAVHGIRCINAIMLLFAHKSMAIFFLPYVNRTSMASTLGQPWTVLGRAASLYTDPFIMLSGTLTAYSLLGRLNKTGKINIGQEYISRLFRIVPTFGALILFCTFILPYLGSGPLWNLVVSQHAIKCKQYWWRNMLFIHNYFGFRDMCLTHSHHIGIDTQLFFISPFLVLILWKWPRQGFTALLSLATLSTIMRYYVTYTRKLSNYIHYGTSVQQLFDTADNMYILPAHRLTVYIMGILLAYILRNTKSLSIKPMYIRIGDTAAVMSFCAAFFGPAFMGDSNYTYNPTHAAWYAAFAPILWCFSFAWVIFTTQVGYKNIMGKLFSSRIFLLWTKVSYTVYLTQFPIFFFNVGSTRESKHFGFFTMMLNLQEYVWVLVMSGALTLIFETPFQNIRNIVFREKKVKEN